MSRFRSSPQTTRVCHRLDLPEVLLNKRPRTREGQRFAPQPEAQPTRAVRPAPGPAPVKPASQEPEVVREAILTLERRLRKLAGALENQEALLLQMRGKGGDPEGVASVYREVQGLVGDHPETRRKVDLMRRIFESNQELRERITSLRRMTE
ncbi:MAG: hypothetical protein R3F33_08500 [Planctomycetota bacterium]